MAWVAIPQSLGDDPRLDALGDAGIAAIVRLYCYCGEHETDGRLSIARAERLTPREILTALVGLGLLVRDDAGYLIQDFLVHNLSHEARDHAREKARERKAAWMERRSERRSEREEERRPERCKTGTGTGTGMGMERTVPDKPPSEACESAPPPRDVPRIPKPRKVPTGDHPELIALFCELFEAATGSKPTIGAKDGAVMARMLKTHGRPVIEERMRRCFEQRVPEYVWRDGPPTLSGFLSAAVFDKLAHVAPATPDYTKPGPNGRLSPMAFLQMDLS